MAYQILRVVVLSILSNTQQNRKLSPILFTPPYNRSQNLLYTLNLDVTFGVLIADIVDILFAVFKKGYYNTNMRHSISLAILLAALWLLNSGHYTNLLLGLGAASILFVIYIARLMDIIDDESQPLKISHRLPTYWLWLLKELIASNIDVVKHIWTPQLTISPVVTTVEISQTSDIAKVIYANSLTLTPGTACIDLQDNTMTVHALSEKSLIGLQEGDMDKRVSRLER